MLSSHFQQVLKPKSLTGDLYLSAVFLIALVPASVWVPFKVAVVGLILATVAIALIDPARRISITNAGVVCVLSYLSVLAGLTGYTIYIQHVELPSVFSAAGRYAALPMLVFAGYCLIEWKYVTSKAILQAIFIGHFGYTIFKVGALVVARIAGLTPEEIIEVASTILPGATIHGFTGNHVFVRIFLGNDAVAPILIGLYLLSLREKVISHSLWGDLFLVLNVVVVAVAFSRFVWILTSTVILAFIVIYTPIITKRTALRIILGTAIAATTVSFVVSGVGGEPGLGEGASFSSPVSERAGDKLSLDEKRLQIELMWSAFCETPMFGRGIGSHLDGHLRLDELDFQYEVQWLALLMQMGILGFLAVAIITTTPLWPIVKRRDKYVLDRDGFYLALIYFLWLAGAFTNPYLFILNSSLVYLGILAMSKELLQKSRSTRDTVLTGAV